jgi:hypothetical protein
MTPPIPKETLLLYISADVLWNSAAPSGTTRLRAF